MSIETADVVRKLALGQSAILAVLIVWTIIRYTKKVIAAPNPDVRALPAHVALIATSYLHFMGYVCFSLYEKLGDEPTWRIPLAMSGCLFGTAAMAFLLAHLSAGRYLRARIDQQADKVIAAASAKKLETDERRMDRMERLGQETHDVVQGIQQDTLPEIKEAAKHAYHEANEINTKIADIGEKRAMKIEEVISSLRDIQTEARSAKETAKVVSDKADSLEEIGTDTNIRVRKMQSGDDIAKTTAKDVADKAGRHSVVSAETNKRVKKLENGHGDKPPEPQ